MRIGASLSRLARPPRPSFVDHVHPAEGTIVVVLEPLEDAVFVEPVVATAFRRAPVAVGRGIGGGRRRCRCRHSRPRPL